MRPTSMLSTVTGRDRPGVTAAFFFALAAHDVEFDVAALQPVEEAGWNAG